MTGVLLLYARRCAGCALLATICAAGCTASGDRRTVDPFLARGQSAAPTSVPRGAPQISGGTVSVLAPPPPAANQPGGVRPVAYETAPNPPGPIADCDDPFVGQNELSPDRLVEEVLRRNPSLAALAAAWQAAAERYPQVVSLDDPTLNTMIGPGTFGDPTHDVAWMVEASQKIPWSGKRPLRGEMADAQASAARLDVGDAELRLAEAAKLAFLDYYLARRELALNADNLRAVQESRETARSKYRANLVTQQDVLQADVDLADLQRRQLELQRTDRVAIARVNTLLHRAPDQPLPPPPVRLPAAPPTPQLDVLRQLAVERRPDLAALGAKIREEQAALELACRDYYPDLEVFGRYDAFWQHADRQLAPAVGLNFNVPLDNERRRAAVHEAELRLGQRRAEYEAKLDEVLSDVQIAYEQLEESRRAVGLYHDKLLPAAEQNVGSARSGYVADKVDFLRFIDAQRQLLMIRERSEVAVADHHRRLAELERIVGGPVTGASEEIPKPPK